MNAAKIGKWCAGLALASAALWFSNDGAAEPALVVVGFNPVSSCIVPPDGQEFYAEAWGYANNVKVCEISQRMTTNGLYGGGRCKGQLIPTLTPNLQKAVITTRAVGTRQFIAVKANDDPRPFMNLSLTSYNPGCPSAMQAASKGYDWAVTQ